MVSLNVSLPPLALSDLVIVHVALDQAQPFLLPLLSALNFALTGLVASLLTLQPVTQLFTVAVLSVPNHLVVALLATQLSLIVLILVSKGVVNEDILTVYD